MHIRKIELNALSQLNQIAMRYFVSELQNHGFAILKTTGLEGSDAISRTLETAHNMKTFRFPAHDSPIVYTEDKRASFRSLFQWSRTCLRAILKSLDPNGQHSDHILKALESPEGIKSLFPPNNLGHSPFPEGVDFSSSFYNIFHYDYGLLNHHKDRYLVTVVAANVSSNTENRTCLWAKSPTVGWVNIDDILKPDEVAVFTGEDFEDLTTQLGTPIPAVLHCTRVDPTGPRLPRYDNQPDPSTPTTGNRVSMAFVLSNGADEP